MAQSCLLEKGTKLHVIIGNPPSNYHEDLFSQFKAECKNQMLLVSGYWIPITYTSGCWDRHVKKVDTETKFSVILIFAINAFIWCNFEKKMFGARHCVSTFEIDNLCSKGDTPVPKEKMLRIWIFCSFSGRIEDTMYCFRDFLTFKYLPDHYFFY